MLDATAGCPEYDRCPSIQCYKQRGPSAQAPAFTASGRRLLTEYAPAAGMVKKDTIGISWRWMCGYEPWLIGSRGCGDSPRRG